MLKTPVLWNVYNRPQLAAAVLEAIRKAQPERLYISADGPRPNDPQDRARCEAVRELVSKVDWPCEVRVRFLEKNQGCRETVYAAITWFFEQEETGIILEDDALPHESFFAFCEEMLARYASNENIYSVSGNSFFPDELNLSASYFASKYFQMWGWATWKRAWKGFDLELKQERKELLDRILPETHPNPRELAVWKMVWTNLEDKELSSWAYPFMYFVWARRGFHLAPAKNLVKNIGYGEQGTHTTQESPLGDLPVYALDEIIHPTELKLSRDLDNLIFYLRILESSYCKRAFREAMFGPELRQARAGR
jgi:hypothetical protein